MKNLYLCLAFAGLCCFAVFRVNATVIDIAVETRDNNLIVVPQISNKTSEFETRVIYTDLQLGVQKQTSWQPLGSITVAAEEGKLYDITLEVRDIYTKDVQRLEESAVSLANLFQSKPQKPTLKIQSKSASIASWQNSFSVEANSFPLVSITADLIYDGFVFDGSSDNFPFLTDNEIGIVEDGRVEQITRLVQPDPNSSVKIVDIVFVHDDSGSLDDEAAQVRENITSFLQGLNDENFDFRVGLLPYGGDGAAASFSEPAGTLLDNGSLTNDPAVFQALIDQMLFDGGDERAFDAIELAVSASLWRPNTQKVIILVTDEDNDSGSISETTVTQSLVDNNILFYGLTGGHSEFNRLADAVSGSVFDIRSDFSIILTEIGTDLTSRYNVQYVTDNSNFDGIERVVDFTIDALDSNGGPINGKFEVRYTPAIPVSIELSADTNALIGSGQIPGKSLPIRAMIDSQIALSDVQLAYKHSSDTGYILANMLIQADGSWVASIPDSIVREGAVNFYLQVNSDDGSKTLPASDQQSNPFIITVYPNLPPIVSHIPITSSPSEQDILIEAVAEDATNEVSTMKLFYRSFGAPIYDEISTDFNLSKAEFNNVIPANAVTSVGVEYYLLATDDFGSESYSGSPDTPHLVVVANDNIPANCNDFANVSICADVFTVSEDMSTTTASGNVQFGLVTQTDTVLSFSGSLNINNLTSAVHTVGPGNLSARNIILGNNLSKDIPIMNQNFSFEGNNSNVTIAPEVDFPVLIEGIPTLGKSVRLGGNGIGIDSAISMPVYLDYTTTVSQYFSISLGEGMVLSQVKGESSGVIEVNLLDPASEIITVGKYGATGLSFALNTLVVDIFAPRLTFGGDAVWNKSKYELEVGIGLSSPISFDSLDFEWMPPEKIQSFATARKIPIAATGIVWVHNKTSLGWKRIPAHSLSGSVTGYFSGISGAIALVGEAIGKDVLSGTMALTVTNSGHTWSSSGSLELLETFPLADAQMTAGKLSSGQNGFQIIGTINIADILIGKATLNGEAGSDFGLFSGTADVAVVVPSIGLLAGGKELTGANVELYVKADHSPSDLTAFARGIVKFGALDVGFQIDFSDYKDPDFDWIYDIQSGFSPQAKSFNNNAKLAEFNLSINAGQSSAIFAVVADAGLPDIELVTPSGDILLPEDYLIVLGDPASETQDIVYFDNGTNEAYFAINSPLAGDYSLNVSNEVELTNLNINLILPLGTSDANLILLDEAVEAGQSFDVELDLSNINQAVEAQFFLKAVESGHEFSLDIAEFNIGGINSHSLTLPSTLTPGEYALSAKIRGQKMNTVTAITNDLITVENTAAPAQPAIISATSNNAAVTLTWTESLNENLDGYQIRVVEDASQISRAIVVAADVNEYNIENLTNGQTYSISVAAFNSDGIASAYSSIASGAPIGSFVGGAPDLSFIAGSAVVTSITGNIGDPISAQAIVTNIGVFTAFSARINCFYDTVSSSNLVESRLLGNLDAGETDAVSCEIDQSKFEGAGGEIFFTITEAALPELKLTNNAIIMVNPYRKNTLPILVEDNFSGNEDEQLDLDVLANDSDFDDDLLSITSVTQPENGVTSILDGRVIYMPNADFNGSDIFTYQASDGDLNAIDVSVTIDVLPINDPPIVDDSSGLTFSEGTDATLSVTASDVEGEELTFSWIQVDGPEFIITSPDSAAATIGGIYVEADAVATFLVEVSDGELISTKEITVNILNDNQAPTLSIEAPTSIDEGQTVTINISADDSQSSGLQYVWEQISGPSVTSASLVSTTESTSLTVTFPLVEQNSTVIFNIIVSDPELSTIEVVTININNITESTSPPTGDNGSSGGALSYVWFMLILSVYMRRNRKLPL